MCVKADAEALPFEDNTFHLYTIAFGLRNVTDVSSNLAANVVIHSASGDTKLTHSLHGADVLLFMCHFRISGTFTRCYVACDVRIMHRSPYAWSAVGYRCSMYVDLKVTR